MIKIIKVETRKKGFKEKVSDAFVDRMHIFQTYELVCLSKNRILTITCVNH